MIKKLFLFSVINIFLDDLLIKILELDIVSNVFPDLEIIRLIFLFLSYLIGMLDKLSIKVKIFFFIYKNL